MLQRRRNVEEGARARNRSRRYQVRAAKRRDRDRRLAAERRRCHGELANRIPGQGTTVKTEKLSYKAWQRQYAKSTKARSAGMFVSILGNKPGCELIEFGTRYTCLSQFCHVDGTYTKKALNQRFHPFPDGTKVGPAKSWTGAQAFLRVASDGFESARGRGFALPHAVLGVRAGRSKNNAECTREAGNAVAVAHLAAVRVLENGAVGTQAPAFGGSFTHSNR
jgi:putative transposase